MIILILYLIIHTKSNLMGHFIFQPKNHDNITDGDSEAQTKSVNGEIKGNSL